MEEEPSAGSLGETRLREHAEGPIDEARRFAFIREETRFEIGLLHDRINALINAEAFLTIAFTMALGNSIARQGTTAFTVVPVVLSLVGLVLATLAWPGVDASYRIIVEWSVRQRQFMQENPQTTHLMWRLEVLRKRNLRADPDTRITMFFARAVPAVFGLAWTILTVVAVILPLRR